MPEYAKVVDITLKEGEERTIDLGFFQPLGKVECTALEQLHYQDLTTWKALEPTDNFHGITARYIKFRAKKATQLTVYAGPGFVAEPDERWTAPFRRTHGWMGGDGIFSFNLNGGVDAFDQQQAKTLFVFGDTLVGRSDDAGFKRLRPLLMPNNSIAYLQGNGHDHLDVDFRLNINQEDNIVSFIEPNNPSMYDGTVAEHLIRDTHRDEDRNYLSGFNPKQLTLIFDLTYPQHVRSLEIVNYFDRYAPDAESLNRGIKTFTLSVAHDTGQTWVSLGTRKLEKARTADDAQVFVVEQSCRYIKMDVPVENGIGNHYPKNAENECVFGLKHVRIHNDDRPITDVRVTATSVMSREKLKSWFWLQDGVVIGTHIYFLPLLVLPDSSKPEGLQFDVRGVSLIAAPIVNGEVDFPAHTQKDTPLYRYHDDTLWLFGAAILPNFAEAGTHDPDGYVYVYGYTTKAHTRALRVARVKPEAFVHLDRYEYYAEGVWVKDMLKASPLLEHISCEMSVTPIESGPFKGKVLAVFQYDVDSRYVAYSIGETPWGPFTEPRIVYECPERETLGGKAYTYNAKAHPHLSTPGSLLVSYNVNSYDMQQHFDSIDVYRPRFIRLKDSSQ